MFHIIAISSSPSILNHQSVRWRIIKLNYYYQSPVQLRNLVNLQSDLIIKASFSLEQKLKLY